MKYIQYSILGLCAGFLSAALGIGAGAIIVAILVTWTNLDIKKAIGSSLATIVPTSLVGVITHFVVNPLNPQLKIAGLIILGSIVGTKYGSALANRLRTKTLRLSFAVFMFVVGLKLIGIIKIPDQSLGQASFIFLIVLGLIVGSAAALFGIGGGAIMIPIMLIFFDLSIHEAIATSLLVILPTTLAGALFHRKLHNIDKKAVSFLVPTALVGAIFGAITTNVLPETIITLAFGILVLSLSTKVFFDTKKA